MNKYVFSVILTVEVDAFSMEDAVEAVENSFGEGSVCDLNVTDFDVIDSARL